MVAKISIQTIAVGKFEQGEAPVQEVEMLEICTKFTRTLLGVRKIFRSSEMQGVHGDPREWVK